MAADQRSESRARWARQAAGWRRRADQLRRQTMPVSARMLDALAPQPGHTVLELAAGIGDLGFLAAEMIEPGGTLICSDFVPEMLSAAQERAAQLGLANVRFRQIDAETIDQPAATLDGVLCRWGYMLMADPEAALRETRRVLKPGGRLALAAWTAADENPWSSLPQRELQERGLAEPPDPAAPGQFTWADPDTIADAMHSAGFVEFDIDPVAFPMRYDGFEHWWETQLDLSSSLRDSMAAADAGAVEELRDSLRAATVGFAEPDGGGLALPARTWVVAAVA